MYTLYTSSIYTLFLHTFIHIGVRKEKIKSLFKSLYFSNEARRKPPIFSEKIGEVGHSGVSYKPTEDFDRLMFFQKKLEVLVCLIAPQERSDRELKEFFG